MRGTIAIVMTGLALAMLYACSSSSGSSSTPTGDDAGEDAAVVKKEAGATIDAEQRESAAFPDDDGGIVPIQCTTADYDRHDYVDAGADVVVATVQGPTGPTPQQYAPNCLRVKVGAKVDFAGNFSLHPIQIDYKPDAGGGGATTGGNGVKTQYLFPGEFGFDCHAHPGLMFGAVQVVP